MVDKAEISRTKNSAAAPPSSKRIKMGPGADKHVRARGIVVCSAGVECGREAWRGGIGERRAWQVAWVGVSGGEGGAPS